jgi:hypothetical protein
MPGNQTETMSNWDKVTKNDRILTLCQNAVSFEAQLCCILTIALKCGDFRRLMHHIHGPEMGL